MPHEKLADYLEKAELGEQGSRTGSVMAMPLGIRKPKREETPPETFSLADGDLTLPSWHMQSRKQLTEESPVSEAQE